MTSLNNGGLSPIIWSGAIGAVVALFGATLLALFNAWHSSREKDRDRTMVLRKEVYLPLVASFPAAWNMLCKLPSNADFDEEPLMAFSACAHRLVAVAETDTAIIASELSTAVGSTFIELMRLAMPAHELLIDAKIAKEYRIKSSQKAELGQAKIDEHLQSGKAFDLSFEALRINVNYHNDQSQENWAIENKAIHQHAIHTLAYLRKIIEILPPLDILRINLLLALRNDMGLKTSEYEFRKSMEQECSKMVISIGKLITDLEQKIHEAK
jgi:hypothetical protein